LDAAFHADFAVRWLDAWNSHDTDTVLDLVDPEVVWDDRIFWTKVINGTDELRTYVERIWQVMPDVQFEEIQRFVAPDLSRGLVLFRQWGSGPPQLAPDASFETYGCDIFLQFRQGRLSHYLGCYELTDMMRQVDMLPPRGNKIGGAYLMSLLRGGDQR
jgi:steroid delta-isomerase-like uncharacterized protein